MKTFLWLLALGIDGGSNDARAGELAAVNSLEIDPTR